MDTEKIKEKAGKAWESAGPVVTWIFKAVWTVIKWFFKAIWWIMKNFKFQKTGMWK